MESASATVAGASSQRPHTNIWKKEARLGGSGPRGKEETWEWGYCYLFFFFATFFLAFLAAIYSPPLVLNDFRKSVNLL
jgi:hypothetical protein